MASFKQLSKYNWKVQVSLGYKEGKKQLAIQQGFRTKKDAERWANDVLDKHDKGYVIPEKNNTLFKDFLNKWFNEHKSKTLSINTFANYKSRIDNHIIPYLGDYKLTKITNVMVQDFYNNLVGNGMKPDSAKKVIEILNGCFKYAYKLKLINSLPTEIERMKEKKALVETWTKEELDFFLNEVKGKYLYLPIFLAALTGLRIGEICGLKWKDVNLEEGYIHVRNQVIQDKIKKETILTEVLKTDTSYRSVSIPKLLCNYLKTFKGEDKEFVVKDRKNGMCTPRNLSMDFTKNVSKYKLSIDEMQEKSKKDMNIYKQLKQISFHGLRHTHATLLILNGENIKVLSQRLGHKDVATTLRTYTHVIKDMEQNTASLLQKMFSNYDIPNSNLNSNLETTKE